MLCLLSPGSTSGAVLVGTFGVEQQKEREKSEGKGTMLRQEETVLFTLNRLGGDVCWS